jgi:hypothetical protein
MKQKLLLMLACAASGTTLMAYTHTVFNTTSGTIRVKLNQILCRNDDVTLAPGESKEISTAGCMSSSLEARGLTGPVAGMSVTADTKGNKAAGYEWYVKYVDFKTTGSSDRQPGVNINLGGSSQPGIIPGSGRLDIEQR